MIYSPPNAMPAVCAQRTVTFDPTQLPLWQRHPYGTAAWYQSFQRRNLVEGFNETREDVNENALWVGERLVPLDRARFTFNRDDVLEPWHITTRDGSVDLTFDALHAHREIKNLGVVKSQFIQPLGLFRGTVNVDGKVLALDRIPGCTEHQAMRW